MSTRGLKIGDYISIDRSSYTVVSESSDLFPIFDIGVVLSINEHNPNYKFYIVSCYIRPIKWVYSPHIMTAIDIKVITKKEFFSFKRTLSFIRNFV